MEMVMRAIMPRKNGKNGFTDRDIILKVEPVPILQLNAHHLISRKMVE